MTGWILREYDPASAGIVERELPVRTGQVFVNAYDPASAGVIKEEIR